MHVMSAFHHDVPAVSARVSPANKKAIISVNDGGEAVRRQGGGNVCIASCGDRGLWRDDRNFVHNVFGRACMHTVCVQYSAVMVVV
jgi:hypothetical protein